MKKWLLIISCVIGAACINDPQTTTKEPDSSTIHFHDDTGRPAPIDTTPKAEADTTKPVTYIARGNEPGWIVTIVENKYIKYIGDYGQDSVLFPYLSSAFNKRLIFKTYKGDRSLQVEFFKQTCTDDAGMKYPYMVKVNVSGSTELRGCGEKK